MPRLDPLLRMRDFQLGGVERNGAYVTITLENNTYIIRRSPNHPLGHAVKSCGKLRHARQIASDLRASDLKQSNSDFHVRHAKRVR